ncbi:MAG TPA: hypothetical protein VN664_11075 [Burkholderiales bacterium]|jgi:hypothetical protein|nr:hypothetical protein [Burkholderiales bacterium]
MKTSRIAVSESGTRPNVRLAIVTTVLLIGALLACFSSYIRAAEPFARGNTTGSIYLGAGRALDREYTTLGGTLGYMVSEGLMLGVSAEMWLGNEPDIYKFTPEVRYTFTKPARVKPYVGAFVSRTTYDGLPDTNTYGARGGIYMPFSSNAAFNVGVVYEKVSDCNEATYNDCSQLYPEAGVLFSF